MGPKDFAAIWKSRIMATALGFAAAGASLVSSSALASIERSEPQSKLESILEASRLIQGLHVREEGKSTGGGAQEAQWLSYFQNFANWNNWLNFNQWGNY